MNTERGRAWIRLQDKMNKGKNEGSIEICKPEKKMEDALP
jgi:hypothetical protein